MKILAPVRSAFLHRAACNDGHGARLGPVELVRIAVKAGIIAVLASLWVDGQQQCSDVPMARHRRSECIDAFAATRWHEASGACPREADATDGSALGIRDARAQLNLASDLPSVNEALRSAQ